jgi:hypothetical protein
MSVFRINRLSVLRPHVSFSTFLAGLVLISGALFFSAHAQEAIERAVVEGSNDELYVEGTNRAGDARIAEFLGRKALWLKNSTQVMRSGIEFVEGTIEFDLAPMVQGNFAGIIFRRVSFGNHENIYLRLHRSGLYNAVQYAPRMNFSPTWQLYPEFNAVADFPKNQWTHVRVEVRSTSMDMYVNNQTKPVLVVPRLRGTTDKGAVAFWGRVNEKPTEWAAAISNISIRPVKPSTTERASPAAPPAGTLTSWELGGPLKATSGAVMRLHEIKEWQAVGVEESGLVNINRALRRAADRSTAFARTTVKATQSRSVILEIGYSDDVTVFLNGEPAYSGINGFDSRHPEYMGFVKPEYEKVFLKLRPGNNEIVVAVTDDQRFGWGFIARLRELN